MKALPLDTTLLAACARFDALEVQIEAHQCTVTDPVFDGLMKKQNKLIDKLKAMTPRTPEGRQARARVAYGLGFGPINGIPESAEA